MKAIAKLSVAGAVALTLFAGAGTAASTKPSVAVFEFGVKPGQGSWPAKGADLLQKYVISALRPAAKVTVATEARTDAAVASLGGYAGADDERLLKAARTLKVTSLLTGLVTEYGVKGSGSRRTVTMTVVARIVSTQSGRVEVWRRELTTSQSVLAKPAATLANRAFSKAGRKIAQLIDTSTGEIVW